MAVTILGQVDWWLDRDDEGYKDYKVKWLARSSYLDGPANVMLAPGLPALGSYWDIDDDLDLQVWCRPSIEVRPVVTDERNRHWFVTQTFSNRPVKSCADSEPDPLLQPAKLGGTFAKFRRESRADKDGYPLVNSARQPITGEIVEVEDPRPTVRISRNVASLALATKTAILRNAPLNDAPLWGVPARHVRFSNYEWDQVFVGSCSTFYYTEHMEFEVDEFDRWYTDRGTATYTGTGDPEDPENYRLYRVPVDGRTQEVFLDGNGSALGPGAAAVEVKLELLNASNLLLLGIPPTL